jgi:ribosomal protein S27AE
MTALDKTEKMICPRCGAEMNHHSDKMVYFNDPQEAGRCDSTVPGHIEEFHACPNCGAGASRRAQADILGQH